MLVELAVLDLRRVTQQTIGFSCTWTTLFGACLAGTYSEAACSVVCSACQPETSCGVAGAMAAQSVCKRRLRPPQELLRAVDAAQGPTRRRWRRQRAPSAQMARTLMLSAQRRTARAQRALPDRGQARGRQPALCALRDPLQTLRGRINALHVLREVAPQAPTLAPSAPPAIRSADQRPRRRCASQFLFQ
jgi:hypothetical protein